MQILKQRGEKDGKQKNRKSQHEHRDRLCAAALPLFEGDAPEVGEEHVERHQDAPREGQQNGRAGEKAPSHFESEELRVPQSAGQRTEEQVHGQPTAFHRHVFTARTVLAVLAQAVGRIGQESAEGNQQDHGQSGDERIGARGLHSGADRRSGVESQREAGAHHARQQGDQQTFGQGMFSWALKENINVSLPSLRVDNFSDELMDELKKIRRSGLTFAQEAGTQRLRDAINKNVTEKEVINTCEKAFAGGWTAVKLYFMMGLPTETLDDIAGIAELAQKVVELYYSNPNKPKGKGVTVSISVASFVPKPHTPFQWEPQDTMDMLVEKQKHLLSSVHSKKIQVSWHQSPTSFLEGVLARGDRKICDVIYSAWEKGCKFDSWDEFFDFDKWMKAFEECGVNPSFYANRKREYDEILPWDHLDYGIRKEFLIDENKKAHMSVTTPNCRQKCAACGAAKLNGGKCDAKC